MIDGKKVLAGSFWKPKKNKYSIPLNCKLVKILEKYGFEKTKKKYLKLKPKDYIKMKLKPILYKMNLLDKIKLRSK